MLPQFNAKTKAAFFIQTEVINQILKDREQLAAFLYEMDV